MEKKEREMTEEELTKEIENKERKLKYLKQIQETLLVKSKGKMNEREWVDFLTSTYIAAHTYEFLQKEQIEELGTVAQNLSQTHNIIIDRIKELEAEGKPSEAELEQLKELAREMANDTFILVVSQEARDIVYQIKNLETAISYKVSSFLAFSKIDDANKQIQSPLITILCQSEILGFKQYLLSVTLGIEAIADYYTTPILNEVAAYLVDSVDSETAKINIPLDAAEFIENFKADKEEYSEWVREAKEYFIEEFVEKERLNGLATYFQELYCRVVFNQLINREGLEGLEQL